MQEDYRSNELKDFLESICEMNSNGSNLHTFKRRESVFQQGDNATSFAYIVSGKLSVINHHAGNSFVITSVSEGEIVGEMGLFLPEKVRTTSVVAAEVTNVLMIDYKKFMDSLSYNHMPLLHMTKLMAARLQATTKHADSIATRGVRDRLVDLLTSVMGSSIATSNDDGSFTLKMSRKEMSLRIGCSRELAGKYLKELEGMGYLRCSGMTVVILPSIVDA